MTQGNIVFAYNARIDLSDAIGPGHTEPYSDHFLASASPALNRFSDDLFWEHGESLAPFSSPTK